MPIWSLQGGCITLWRPLWFTNELIVRWEERREPMSKSKIIALTALITFALATVGVSKPVAAERFKLRTAKYADVWKQIDVEEGHIIVVEEAKGIVSNMEGRSFGDGWALRYVALLDINPKTGVTSGNGYEEMTDKDGDKIYKTWEGKAVAENRWEGEYTILKGTGKFEGIKGKGTFTAYVVAPNQFYTDEEWEVELP